MILDTVETEEESLLSECKWVEKFSEVGHPLLNRWEEHQELIEAGKGPPAEEFEVYFPGNWNMPIGQMKPTPKKAGFSLTFNMDLDIYKGQRLVILPKKEEGA